MSDYMSKQPTPEDLEVDKMWAEKVAMDKANGVVYRTEEELLQSTTTTDALPETGNGYFMGYDNWKDIDITDDWLDMTKPYTPPKWTLSFNGTPFAPLGGIHAMTGQSGHGKTMLFSMIIATILKGEFGGLKYELSESISKPVVLFIDTEQEEDNVIRVKNRIYSILGWSYDCKHDNFYILQIRETEDAIDRWRKTLKAIYEVKPTVAIIDGLLDVVEDFNNIEMCQSLIYKCMRVASHYNISLWCLVHQNPGNETKMVGNIGSMLERKVTDVLCSQLDLSKGIFTVKPLKGRMKRINDFKFVVNDDANHFGIPEIIDFGEIAQQAISLPEKVEEWLKENQETITWPVSATELKQFFRSMGIKNTNQQQECVTIAKNKRLVIEADREEGKKYAKLILNPELFENNQQ